MIAQSKTELFQVFKSFDKDGSGFVDKSELISIAKQLNQELSNDEVNKLMAVVDVNKDGQISFEEFWNWWQFGKNGHLEKLVFMKLKLMNLLKKVNSEFTRFGVSFFDKYDKQFDHHYWAINYGDQPCHFKVDASYVYNGKGVQDYLTKENQNLKGLQLTPSKFVDITFAIRALKPEIAKTKFQELFDTLLQKLQSDSGDEEFYDFLSKTELKLTTSNEYLFVNFIIKHPIVQDFVETQYSPFLEQMGEDIEFNVDLTVGVKNGLKKMMKKNQIFIKYLLEGFLVEFKAKFNTNLAKKMFNIGLFMVQAAFQSKQQSGKKAVSKFKQAFTLPLLFKSSKFHLQFKNMEDVDAFLRAMGLEELVEDQPNARDLLQESFTEDEIQEIKDPQEDSHFIYQLYKFGCEHLIARGYAYGVMPNGFLKLDYNFEGLQDVCECLFREDPESLKKQQ